MAFQLTKIQVQRIQPLIELIQTPIQNTWYTVCDLTNVRVYQAKTMIENTEAAAKDVEVRLNIDDLPEITDTENNASGATVMIIIRPASFGTVNQVTGISQNAGIFCFNDGVKDEWKFLDFAHFKLEVRTTSAVGTAPVLSAWVSYAKLT